MKNNIESENNIKEECPVESMEQYISKLEVDSEDKIKKELLTELKKELELLIKS